MGEDPLWLLCVEPHFPGRLGAVADWLVRRRGYRCHFYCATADPPAHWPASTGRGLDVVPFKVGGVARESAAPWTRSLERSLCYSFGCFEVLDARRPRPVDLVLGRSASLGSTLFAPVALPGAPVVNLFDYWMAPHANDLAAEIGPGAPPEYFHWRRTAGAYDLLELESAAGAWTHTAWQRDLFPGEYRDGFLVLHDGVDAAALAAPRPRAVAGRTVPDDVKVVTFVARCLDQLRGFDRFMALANRLLAERRDLLFVVVGDPVVRRALDVRHHGQDYRKVVLGREPPADEGRFWFLGAVPPATVAEALAVSELVVYPSRPYPVARSLLEAMAAGRAVLAWDTEPVREVVTHGRSGLLVPADDPEAAAREALRVLDDPAGHRALGEAAAEVVRERYDRDVTLPRLAAWLAGLAGGGV
ncbi:MAG TPA: glycosyltransferase [Gemmataceae bacterium]|nr:glycosyltransferase [Gemmataceae bacterium]